MGEGERAPARSPQLCEARATSGGAMEYGGHALGVFCPRHPSSLCYFEWKYEGERDEMEPKRIFVWWVKYVDTMRPRIVRCRMWDGCLQ
jgi:hypothetical protein